MILSKSFGYALRSILYVAMMHNEKRNIQLKEIAEKLDVPRHFLGKVMMRLVKNGIVDSAKGHAGGYTMNGETLSINIIDLVTLIDGDAIFNTCVIGFKKCNETNPCSLHCRMQETRKLLIKTFSDTTIGDLLGKDIPVPV